MKLPAVLEALPDETMVSLGYLRSVKDAEIVGAEIITTVRASELWSYSPDSWSKWAKEGKIAGAWQDGDGGIWRLPYESCAAHIERLSWEARKPTHRRKRTPWGETAKPPATTAVQDVLRLHRGAR